MKFTLQCLLVIAVIGICIFSLSSALYSLISGEIVVGLLSAVIAVGSGYCSTKLIDWSLN